MTYAIFENKECNENHVVKFMMDFIAQNYGNRPGVNEAEHMELAFLRKEVDSLQAELGEAPEVVNARRSIVDSSDDEEDEEDFVEELPTVL